MKKTVFILIFCCPFLFMNSQNSQTGKGIVDMIIFGNTESEQKHNLNSEFSTIKQAALNQPARVIEKTGSKPEEGTCLSFEINVDPLLQNYFTLKYWGSDASGILNIVSIDGKQIGYNRSSDYSPINAGFGAALPGRFYYSTIMLPLHTTKGKNKVELSVKSIGKPQNVHREIYQGYVHTNPYLDFKKEKQGVKPISDLKQIVAQDIPETEKQKLLQEHRQMQINDFNNYSSFLDQHTDGKLSIVKYRDDLRYYASMLIEPWCPAKTKEEKRKALFRIFQSIDNHVKDYYADTRIVTRGGHQGDWGGFLGALGDALYIVENIIFDDTILGINAFNEYLNERFNTHTTEGVFSLADADWNGNPLTRKAAWERALKANFDFSRTRLSYIYNQVYYTYEGTWKAHEGLRIIGSPFYEGKERSHEILGVALGFKPFLGEEVLVGPDGEELDLYHSLFYHDYYVLFTDDFQQVVAKGLAKSKLDDSGNIVRRLPYGRHYTGISQNGLSRENGYVGNYGETLNYLPEWFYRTLNHKGDEQLNDDILKLALYNLHARGYTRYTAVNEHGKRMMRMQQVLDDRNVSYPGMPAYAVRTSHGKIFQYASLEKHMKENAERYSSSEWDKYWEYAAEIAGFAQQQLMDNQYFPSLEDESKRKTILDVRKYDFCLPETYTYLTSGYDKIRVHPLTDFDYYTEEELKRYNINKNDYKQFAWADIDCMMAVVRDGDKVLSGVFNYHNRGYSGCGRMHIQNNNYDHIVQIATRAKYQYNEYYIRMNSLEMDFLSSVSDLFTDTKQALAGEVCPITYQPGVGKVVRENFDADHPYSGYPDYLEAQYGQYLFVFNTTRPQYGNEQVFSVELPAQYKKSTISDLISGKTLPVKKGKVTIQPNSALVLKLDKDSYSNMKPDAVHFATALAGNNRAAINWKESSGADSYTIKRSYNENGTYEVIARDIKGTFYVDEDITNGTTAYYKVTAVNKYGEAWDSYRTKITLENVILHTEHPTNWRNDKVGIVTSGNASIDNSKITITDVTGKGLGEGDDYMIHTRDIQDSFLFVNTIINGSAEISAKFMWGRSDIQGLMFRDQLSADTRYIFLGCNKFGHIVFQNRTKNTQHEYRNHKISPYKWPVVHQTIFDYPYLKLSRNADNHMVAGYISKDGENWEKIGELFTPLPTATYTGVSAANTQNVIFDEVQINYRNK